MPQNIFKIYNGRTNFWQWETHQKLIVLDDSITEVNFSNRDMNHSITKDVYEKDGLKLCNVPDILLQLPKNLVADACTDGSTVKSVKFAVAKRAIPEGYVIDQSEDLDDKLTQIDIRLDSLDENKADNIYYDEEEKYIQLVSNGEKIGNRVNVASSDVCGVEDCKVDDEGHLIVTLSDGRVIDAGHVEGSDGATFTPHISEDQILTWTCDQDLPVPDPIDLNPHDEWSTLPEEGMETEYEWEYM